jgi:uncharacterized protein YndB with AHSA1/START domain
MTDTATNSGTSVTTSIEVAASVERAFTVFTDGIESWWNPDHHIIEAPLAGMVLEPFAGGRIYDKGTDGSECTWSRVLAFERPHRLVFTWDISLHWQIETDPARCSEVEVRFIPQGPDRTLVELEHRHLDRHGEGWESMRSAVSAADGWDSGLSRLAAVLGGGTVG